MDTNKLSLLGLKLLLVCGCRGKMRRKGGSLSSSASCVCSPSFWNSYKKRFKMFTSYWKGITWSERQGRASCSGLPDRLTLEGVWIWGSDHTPSTYFLLHPSLCTSHLCLFLLAVIGSWVLRAGGWRPGPFISDLSGPRAILSFCWSEGHEFFIGSPSAFMLTQHPRSI